MTNTLAIVSGLGILGVACLVPLAFMPMNVTVDAGPKIMCESGFFVLEFAAATVLARAYRHRSRRR